MDAPTPEIPFLKNIGLLVTMKCQVACPHCIIEAGPQRSEAMRLDEAFDWIEQIAVYRRGHIRVLSLTGGEPFFDLRTLQDISDYANELGLFVSAVTNAYWAASPERALRVLRSVPALRMIQISTDVYHQKNIPFERVRYAADAARACDIPFTVAVCTDNALDPGYLQILEQLQGVVAPEGIYTAITFPAGRALQRAGGGNYETTSEPPVTACGAGSAPIVFPDGRVIACIGPIIDLETPHPLVLGNLREEPLEVILDRAETNPILHAIRLWGPKRLIEMYQAAGGDGLPKAYIKGSVCHACYELMARPHVVQFLTDLRDDAAFRRVVAYGRLYYMKEAEMVRALKL